MNNKQVSIIKQQLTIKDGQPVVSSLTIAEAFGKQHKHVLRDIETLDCSPEFRRPNFGPIFYKDSFGREQRAYEMTKNGYMFLVMGYSGEKAGRIKEGYIYAFDLLLDECRSGMAATVAAANNALLAVIAEAAVKGYPASFIPEMIFFRRAGMSMVQIGRALKVCKDTVSLWLRKVRLAGVEIPQVVKRPAIITHFQHKTKVENRQLALPGMEVTA